MTVGRLIPSFTHLIPLGTVLISASSSSDSLADIEKGDFSIKPKKRDLERNLFKEQFEAISEAQLSFHGERSQIRACQVRAGHISQVRSEFMSGQRQQRCNSSLMASLGSHRCQFQSSRGRAIP